MGTTLNAFGAKLSPVDLRDYKVASNTTVEYPESFELKNMPEVKNQFQVSSCVAHSSSTILEYHDNKDSKGHTLSTNFIYGIQNKYCGRDGSGMYLRDACKIIKDLGTPEESLCKGNNEVPEAYVIAEDAYATEATMKNASYFKIASYARCNDANAIKNALMNYGPVLASVKWLNAFKVNRGSGILSGPITGEGGYHAIVIYGWNETGWLCQNSWGKSFGNMGRFIYPYNYKIAEAWSILDSDIDIDNSNIIKPKTNKITTIMYKIINVIINAFKHFNKK